MYDTTFNAFHASLFDLDIYFVLCVALAMTLFLSCSARFSSAKEGTNVLLFWVVRGTANAPLLTSLSRRSTNDTVHEYALSTYHVGEMFVAIDVSHPDTQFRGVVV